MDKLEGSPVPLSGEHTQALYQSLEAFADTFINSLHSAKTRLAGAHFEGKDTQIHIKQSFHSLLAIADEQFMEHVSAKPEPTPGPDAKVAGATEAGTDSAQNTQKVSEKLKEAANISFLSCSKYIEEEGKLQAERGDRLTRMSSMNSQSMFATFRSDLRLPPIIDSVAYKGDKHLGLCRNYQVVASSNASSTTPTTGGATTANSEGTVPAPNLTTSELVPGPNQQNRNPGVAPPVQSQPTGSVPARAAGPGGIPPPPMSLDQLMAHSKKVDEARKRGEVPPPPPFSLPQLEANSRYLDGQRSQQQADSQPAVDEEPTPQLSYKDQLSRLLGQPKSGGDNRPESSTAGTRSTPGDSGSLDSSSSSVGQKMSKTGSLLMQSQMAAGISKASGFFDDDEDDGETLIQRSKAPSNTSSRPPANDGRPPARNAPQEYAPPEGGDMLTSILSKKNAPTVIDESNPFSSRPKRKNMLLLKDDNSDEDEADKKVNKKLQSLMNDSDDEDAKRKRLLEKYSSKTQSKDAPAETAKPKKPKALQSSDEEPVPKPAKGSKPKATSKLSDEEEVPKPKAPSKPSAATTKKKVLQDSSDEEKPVKPKVAETKKKISEPEQVPEVVSKQPKPIIDQPAVPKPEPAKKPVEKAPNSDEEQSPPKAAPKRNMDFLSKLNSQLGQGPKEGVGLIKSIVVEDGPTDFNPRKPSGNDDDEPSLLPQVYRSMRGSVDDKSSIKDLKDVYFGDDKPKPEETTKIRESMAKKAKRDSISEAAQEVKQAAPEAKSTPAMLRGNQKGAFDASSDEDKPKPAVVTAPAPTTMLRGNKKGAFDNSSDEETAKPKAPVVETKPAPTMLRGNQKGAFDGSSDEEPPKAPTKPAPQATAGPAMLRGNQKGAFDASSDEDKPKPVAAKAPAPAMLRGNQKGAFDNSSDDEKPAPAARKTQAEPARKNKLIDSDDEQPKPKTSKPALKKDSSDEDFGRSKKGDKGPARTAGMKKPAWGGDSDDEQPAKKAPAKESGRAGKKKIFDDDD